MRLKEYANILPFSTAVEFSYINAGLFKFFPKYPRYFHPFSLFKDRTFYYIGDYNNYTPEMLEDDERKAALAIMHIIIFGLTEEETAQLSRISCHKGLKHLCEMEPKYNITIFPIEEFYDLGKDFGSKYDFTEIAPIDFVAMAEMYDLPKFDKDRQVVIFSFA